jgi:GTP-binding protein LepA
MQDPSIEMETSSSQGMGRGIRAGFLGELHVEVVKERLLTEFGIVTIQSPPSVEYLAKF